MMVGEAVVVVVGMRAEWITVVGFLGGAGRTLELRRK